jgi:serine/threonine protein kinase
MKTTGSGNQPQKAISLRTRLLERGPLSPLEASVLLDRLAETIDAAHNQAVDHGAICPENVFLTTDGKVRLGPARVQPVPTPAGAATTASVGYYSPEEAWDEAATVATDIWALGALLYEALTGCVPLPAINPSALATPGVRWGARRLPAASACCQPVIDRSLSRQPSGRYASAQAMANELWELLPQPAPDSSLPRRKRASDTEVMGSLLGLQQAVNRPLRLSGDVGTGWEAARPAVRRKRFRYGAASDGPTR